VTKWVWCYIVWSAWIVLFLGLELSGLWRLTPWVTLSETSWHLEETYRWFYIAFAGFLIGLTVHIVMHVPFWRAMLFGFGVAILAHVLNGWTF
jgi:hypothetical protein